MGLAWKPHHRKGVRRRCIRRMDLLRIRSWEAYLLKLRRDPAEMEMFAQLVHVTISRFFRNAEVFQCIEETVLPALIAAVKPGSPLRVWSAGCANGEEPYSVIMIWEMRFRDRNTLVVDAQDRNPDCIRRALQRRYEFGSLKEVPHHYLTRFFFSQGETWVLREAAARWVQFHLGDLESPPSPELYHMILCRNTTFTYGTLDAQRRVLGRLREHLVRSGHLVIGKKERLPEQEGWSELTPGIRIFQRVD